MVRVQIWKIQCNYIVWNEAFIATWMLYVSISILFSVCVLYSYHMYLIEPSIMCTHECLFLLHILCRRIVYIMLCVSDVSLDSLFWLFHGFGFRYVSPWFVRLNLSPTSTNQYTTQYRKNDKHTCDKIQCNLI